MAYNSNSFSNNNRNNSRTGNFIEFDIRERLGVIGNKDNGWVREANIVSWNGGMPKLDIRDWAPDHERMTKGVTFREEEALCLTAILNRRFGPGSPAAPAPMGSVESRSSGQRIQAEVVTSPFEPRHETPRGPQAGPREDLQGGQQDDRNDEQQDDPFSDPTAEPRDVQTASSSADEQTDDED